MHFNSQKDERENQVKERLIAIRIAEENYRKVNGTYTADFSTLISKNYLKDSMQYIPFSNGEKFNIQISSQISKAGQQTPLMECSALYHQYLNGMNENSIANLIEEANKSGRFPGLKIGDIETANGNAGNWE